MARQPGSASGPIVAYTGEGERFANVRRRAIELGREQGASVIFYDVDAASALASPLPTQWSAEGADDEIPKRLGPDDLAAAGRADLAAEVRRAREEGIEAYGWLPEDAGADDVAEYARTVGASRIIMPAELEEPGPVDRLRGRSTDETRDETSVPVEVV